MGFARATTGLAGLILVVAACGSGSPDATDTPGAADTAAPAPTAPPVEPTAPPADPAAADPVPDAPAAPPILQFTAPLVGGGQIDAASLAGKPTVFWFWAPT